MNARRRTSIDSWTTFGLLLLFVTAIVGAHCSHADEPKRRLLVTIHGNAPFWDAARAGAKQAEQDLKLGDASLTVEFQTAEYTVASHLELLQKAATQPNIAGLAASIIDPNNEAVANELKKLREKGMHVLCLDSDINAEMAPVARQYFLGTNNKAAGELLGTAAAHLLKARMRPEGSYAQFVGLTDLPVSTERMNAFQKSIGMRYRQIGRFSDEGDIARAHDKVESVLQMHPDVSVMVGIWAYNGPAIAKMVAENGKRKQVIVLGMDAPADAIAQMEAGNIDALVVQDPFNMGYQCVRLLAALQQSDDKTVNTMFPHGDEMQGDYYDTGLKLVIPDGSPLQREDFTVEGNPVRTVRLSDFKQWLKQHGLTGT